MKNRSIAGWVLIALGALLLLNQFNWLELDRFLIVLIFSIVFAALLFQKAMGHPMKKGIIGGSFFVFFAIITILMKIGSLPVSDSLGFGLLLMALGVSNFIYFLITRIRIGNIISGVIFILLGLPPVLSYYGYTNSWDIADYYSTYWPVLLILIGGGILIDQLRKRPRKPA